MKNSWHAELKQSRKDVKATMMLFSSGWNTDAFCYNNEIVNVLFSDCD